MPIGTPFFSTTSKTRASALSRITFTSFGAILTMSCPRAIPAMRRTAITIPLPRDMGTSYARRAALAKSPTDPVILAVIARAAPQRLVRSIDHDGVDRPGRAILEYFRVAYAPQLAADPRRCLAVEQDPAGLDLVIAERAAHLEAVEIRRLGRLLHCHSEFHDVEEELQKVLILAVASLH